MTKTLSLRSYRRFKNRVFKALGFLATLALLSILFALLTKVILVAQGAFWRTEITLRLPATLNLHEDSLTQVIAFNEPLLSPMEQKAFASLLSVRAPDLIDQAHSHQKTDPLAVPLSSAFDLYVKSPHVKQNIPQLEHHLLEDLMTRQRIKTVFNWDFFTAGDSREPELAGLGSAFLGSLFVILTTFFFAVPLGVFAAVYLNELAPKNALTGFLDVIIRNLAAVPSVVFGLLGFLVFLHYFELERSSILVGGLVLSLMTLPIIITSSRSALNTVPTYIRDAALGLGATRIQTIFHHVIPYATPGLTTGILLGLSRALGETAPLLMIGMVAFIVDKPTSITDPATTLPVQIYLWTQSPEAGFLEKASAAILILLILLFIMNVTAVWIRHRTERGR